MGAGSASTLRVLGTLPVPQAGNLLPDAAGDVPGICRAINCPSQSWERPGGAGSTRLVAVFGDRRVCDRDLSQEQYRVPDDRSDNKIIDRGCFRHSV